LTDAASNETLQPGRTQEAKPGLSRLVAERAAGLTYDSLPPPVIEAARRGILDTLGVSLAAAGAMPEAIGPVRGFINACAAPGRVPGLALGRRVHTLDAIFWLGALSHALDYDDVAGYSHPSAPVVSATLPLSGMGTVVDGRSLLTAVAIGQDLVIRIAQSVRKPVSDYGWMPSLPGALGAAVASSKLIGLDASGIQASLGLALHQTAGTMESLASPGSEFRGIREAFNARAGAVAALLAANGLAGDPESLEGRYGVLAQFFAGDYDEAFVRQEGLLGARITFKPWACAGHPQLFLTALDELRRGHDLDPGAVARIHISGGSNILPHQCEPQAARTAPGSGIDAKISIPFLLGKLLAHGTLTVEDFAPAGLADPEAIDLARRVTYHVDPSMAGRENSFGRGRVEVELRDGRRLENETEIPLGHPDNPLSWEDIVAKFHRGAEACAPEISAAGAAKVVERVTDLESMGDVSELLELLAGE
jgi:2-methylcitrate dehydratase PrpD